MSSTIEMGTICKCHNKYTLSGTKPPGVNHMSAQLRYKSVDVINDSQASCKFYIQFPIYYTKYLQ